MPMVPAPVRVIRPQQWAKNLLLVLPAAAAHLTPTPDVIRNLLLGFLSFSMAASSAYVLNDMVDVEADRAHPDKKMRPVARGEIEPAAAYVIAIGCLILSVVLAVLLPVRFQAALLVYVVLTFAYSGRLKRVAMLDVVLLATLYSARLVAGSALTDVPLSRWFLAFSTFFFFSLAAAKRVVELRVLSEGSGRGYATSDTQTLSSLGMAASMVAALVYCLYITSQDALKLYARPDALWAGLPILIYWQARVWLLVGRGEMHHDPVVFALRDYVTITLGVMFALLLWYGSK
jgi:4-hydroxybenzoate polyprenyltransferase